jgi:tetratricopeptide (TPR) repeat protein
MHSSRLEPQKPLRAATFMDIGLLTEPASLDDAHDESAQAIQRLFTPATLADLLQLPVSTVRKWHKRGLIKPVCVVKQLPYFDFSEVSAARQVAELVASGMRPIDIEKRLAEWQKYLPHIDRPLSQLALVAAGRTLLLRLEAGLVEPNGQMYFDFDDGEAKTANQIIGDDDETSNVSFSIADALDASTPPEVLAEMAAEMEDLGELSAAADLYRAILAAKGPQPDVCFALAEVLYRKGDLTAARERYSIAVELNEDYVEARANLGCVLAELGDSELAIAAFHGALRYHPDYADVYFHLASTLAHLGRMDEARPHWERFLKLSPDSPWAGEARQQLGE